MSFRISRIVGAAFLVPLVPLAVLADDAVTEGSVTVGGGAYVSVDGSKARLQEHTGHQKDGFGGIEEFNYSLTKGDYTVSFKGKALVGDEDYLADLRVGKGDNLYLDLGYKSFRVYYDGQGGIHLPNGFYADPLIGDPAVDRSSFWAELGYVPPEGFFFKLRYEHDERTGSKSSSSWADTNLTGGAGTRNIVPTIYLLDEKRDIITADLGQKSEDFSWQAGVRSDQGDLNNRRVATRRPGESVERNLVTKDQTSTDIFAAHGYVEKPLGKKLTLTIGGLYTTLDSTLAGTRIFGTGTDPIFDPVSPTRQSRDEGYYGLTGGSDLKQYVGNLNLAWTPTPKLTIVPSLRFENLHVETASEFVETAVGTTSARITAEDDIAGNSDKNWNEVTEAIEARYTGVKNWTFTAGVEALQGDGTLIEDLTDLDTNSIEIDRDTDYTRDTQKYSASANWYAKPGLSFSGGYYYKVRKADYVAVRDTTPSTGGDRYPAYLDTQEFRTHDVNVRMNWRPASTLSFVTRYDYQYNEVLSAEVGLDRVQSSKSTTQIVGETVTWSPVSRLFVTASGNYVSDELSTPASAIVRNWTNDYFFADVTAGYALTEKTDLLAEYSHYKANNFVNQTTFQPFGANERSDTASLTCTVHATEHLVFSLKYAYSEYSDTATAGRDDYTAHLVYGKVQYSF